MRGSWILFLGNENTKGVWKDEGSDWYLVINRFGIVDSMWSTEQLASFRYWILD